MRGLILTLCTFVFAAEAAEARATRMDAKIEPSACENADWFAIGRHDGEKGRPQPVRYTAISKVCVPTGHPPNQDEYFRGYTLGFNRDRR